MTAPIGINTPPSPGFATPLRAEQKSKLLAQFPTPKKYYPITGGTENDPISVRLTPTAKKAEEAIYKFRRKSDNASYVGMATVVQKRVSNHTYSFRHSTTEAGKSQLAQAVRDNPEDFEFGIIVTKDKLTDETGKKLPLGELEGIYIEFNKQKGPSLNRRKGNGGGTSKKDKSNKTAKELAKQVQAVYHTPQKSYKLDKKTYKVQLTPTAEGDVYMLKRVGTLKGNEGIKRYVGRTERTARRRLAEHSHFARANDKPRGKKALYSDMRSFSEQFEVKLLSSKELGFADADELETGLIEFFEGNCELYNETSGSNGPHAAPAQPNKPKYNKPGCARVLFSKEQMYKEQV